MKKAFTALLLALIIYMIYGAFFAWGLQYPLESILDREIRYWDLFLVAVLTMAFLNGPPSNFK